MPIIDTRHMGQTADVSSKSPPPSSSVARWALCGLAIVFGGIVLMRFPPRMVVNRLGMTTTRAFGVGLFAFGLFYVYAVRVNPVTQQYFNPRSAAR